MASNDDGEIMGELFPTDSDTYLITAARVFQGLERLRLRPPDASTLERLKVLEAYWDRLLAYGVERGFIARPS